MEAGFKSNTLDVRTHDGRNFVLLADADYQAADGTLYRMPAGATSDGASTPPILWSKFDRDWIPPFGSYWLAAVLHDCAYRKTLLRFDGVWINADLPKDKCDALLREAMESLGTHALTIDEIYHGVVICGLGSFEADRKAAI